MSTPAQDPEVIESPDHARRVRRGEAEALQNVVRTYLPQIIRAARGAGMPPDTAEDVAQATFATFFETISRFEGRSKIRTWLFGILYRKISEERRAIAKEMKVDPIDEVVEGRFRPDGSWLHVPRPLDEQVYLASEVREKLDACLEQTPVKQRMAFVLKEVSGLSSEEICNTLEVTRTHLGVLLHRVRNRLRECLETKGVKG